MIAVRPRPPVQSEWQASCRPVSNHFAGIGRMPPSHAV